MYNDCPLCGNKLTYGSDSFSIKCKENFNHYVVYQHTPDQIWFEVFQIGNVRIYRDKMGVALLSSSFEDIELKQILSIEQIKKLLILL